MIIIKYKSYALLVDGMKPNVCFLRKSKGSFFDLNYRKGRR